MRRLFGWIPVAIAVALVTACSGEIDLVGIDDPVFLFDDDGVLRPVLPTVVLGVDASRSGVIDLEDSQDLKNRLDPAPGFGALFLANLDDDGRKCVGLVKDADFEACYDATLSGIVDDADLADMAPIYAAPVDGIADDVVGMLDVDEASRRYVRLYRRTGDGEGADAFELYEPGADQISAEELRQGVDFVIEGTSLLPPDGGWDGRVELTWKVTLPEFDHTVEDRAQMELAPLIIPHHMQPARVVYAANLGAENAEFRSDLSDAVEAAGVADGLETFDLWDPWIQDYLLTGYMSIPGPDGPQTIQVYLRSANANYPASLEPVFRRIAQVRSRQHEPQLREAGRFVYTRFHRSGFAGRAIYDEDLGFEPFDMTGKDVDDVARYLMGMSSQQSYPEAADLVESIFDADTLNSYGNTEVIPPHVAPDGTAYPLGRVIRGRGSLVHQRPDPTLSNLFNNQGLQPVVWLDTMWKLVAHVDETISYVESDSERGWSVLYNDPIRAIEMLEELRDERGMGDAVMFEGKVWPSWGGGGSSAEQTVSEVLADEEVMATSARAAVEVQAQVNVLRDQVGIVDEDLVPIAFLHEDAGGGASVAYQPGIINGISLRPDVFGAPKPHGPRVDGVDIFEAETEEVLNAIGVEVHWIETWDVYHTGAGQVHCGSNTEREPSQTPWWAEEMQ